MGAGIPGTGMATLFYLFCAFAMPVGELVRTVHGRSSWARWRLIGRHFVVAAAMTAAVYATFRYLPPALLPPDVTIGGVSALAVTALLFALYLVIVNVLGVLVPGRLILPEPRTLAEDGSFPEREAASPRRGEDGGAPEQRPVVA